MSSNPSATLHNTTGSGANGANLTDGDELTVAKVHVNSGGVVLDWITIDLLVAKQITAIELRNYYCAASVAFFAVGTNDNTITPAPGGSPAAAGTTILTSYTTGVTSNTAASNNSSVQTVTDTGFYRYILIVPRPSSSPNDCFIGEALVRTADTPGTPLSLTVTPGNNQNVLTWSAPTSAPAGTFYRLSYATTIGGVPTLLADNISATTYTHTGLTNGQAYYYYLTAVNPNG